MSLESSIYWLKHKRRKVESEREESEEVEETGNGEDHWKHKKRSPPTAGERTTIATAVSPGDTSKLINLPTLTYSQLAINN